MDKPLIFESDIISLRDIKKEYKIDKTIDTYREQLEDLFLIRNPKYKFNKNYQTDFEKFVAEHSKGKSLEKCGKWVYFPWNSILVHFLDDVEHQEVRMARNRNLITKDEQDKFFKFKVGVTGLSVGSHGALTTVVMGGSKFIKLADPDTVSPSNLNRMRFDFTHIGINKSELAAQYIYQLNPYAEVQIYTEGITEKNIDEFLEGLDVLVEELDDIEIKVRLREEARKKRIPVIMATDSGNNVIVDVERFDLNPDLPIFGGNLDGVNLEEIKKSPKKLFETMAKVIDLSQVSPRALISVSEVGKTIYSWPQLVTAATLSGVVIAYIIERLAIGAPVREGKFKVNLDEIIDPDYKENESIRKRELERFIKTMGL